MRASYISAVFIVMLLLYSCAGNRTISSAGHSLPQTLSDALAQLDALPVPKGVKPEVFQQLKDALAAALRAKGTGKIICTPPTGTANQVNDLAIVDDGDGTFTLRWHYRCLGDYNQDGKVDVADITPLAMHYSEGWATGEENSLAAVADGSNNQIVDVADVTQIAMYFGVQVDHFSVAESPTEGGSYVEIGSVDIETGLDKATKRMRFSYDLAPAAGSWYCAVPHDGAGIPGDESNKVQAAAGTPAAPTGLAAASISSSEIDLAWTDNSSDELGFRIERKEGAAGIWGLIATPAAETNSYPDTSLTANTEYFYRVLAYNGSGDSAWSNEANDTTFVDRTPWAHTFGDTGADIANAIAVDSSGNTYTAGTTDSYSTGGDEDTLVQKYSPSGMPLWRKTWGGSGVEQGYAICVDSAGDIYVTGSTDSFGLGSDEAYVIKYAPDGTLLWQRIWGSAFGSTYAYGVAVDSLGFVYIAGDTYGGAATMYDVFLLKYSTAGALQWQKTWGGALDDYATAIAIDTNGNIDIAGSTMSFGVSGDVVVLQYSPDGTLLWQKTWGGIEGESAYALDTDSSDSVFVAGYASNVGGGIADVCVVKFSSAGALQWQAAWGGSVLDIANALCVDGVGNAWVVGRSSSFGTGSDDVFLLEYSNAGAPLMQRIWGGSDAEFAKGVFVDNSGMAYVSGAAINALSSWFTPFGIETVLTYADAIPGGTEGTPTGIEREPTGMETIPATGVEDTGGGGYDALVMKIDPLVI
jgi:uncharacterized delta-60 repeat protein